MDKLSKNTFIVIISLILLFKLNSNNDYNLKETVFNEKQSIFFETFELISMIILIIYCYLNKNYINGFVILVAFIEHIIQLYKCYRQHSRGIKKIITILIYLVLIYYNYLKNDKFFILFWLFLFLNHLFTIIYNKSLMKVICIKDILK